MKTLFTHWFLTKKPTLILITGFLLFSAGFTATAQLGVYSFTGLGTCPHQNPAVNSQPANATFGNYVFAGGISCKARANEFETMDWANTTNTVNTSEYFGFTVTPASGYSLTLTQLSFNQRYDKDPLSGVTRWVLRSSLDNFTTDIATDTVTLIMQNDVINLPAGSFTNIGAVTFRFYLLNVNSTFLVNWRNDEVSLSGTADVSTPSNSLGLYPFNGAAACPNPNTSVTTQPANATFSLFTNNGGTCVISGAGTDFLIKGWPTSPTPDLGMYNEFSITAAAGYGLRLTSITWKHFWQGSQGASWILRSSLDNFTADLGTGSLSNTPINETVILPASFQFVSPVTFRLYYYNVQTPNQYGANDDVTVFGTVVPVPANPDMPSSNSPQCYNSGGVTLSVAGTAPAGTTWYWQTSPYQMSTANTGSTFLATTSGTYCLRTRDNTTLAWSTGYQCLNVIISQAAQTPVFTLGNSSNRCQAAAVISYAATAAAGNTTTYSLDAASLAAGNTINSTTGAVTWLASWSGASVVTATATDCNGAQLSANHNVNPTPAVGTPVFALGASSFRCKASSSVTYNASASNNLGITYSLDGASLSAGVTINSGTGLVTYPSGWGGVSTITASAAGCNGPTTAQHMASSLSSLSTPSFTLGNSSSRCQGAGMVTYTATESNAFSISYSLDASSISGGNSINSATGQVTYVATWSGLTFVTATATGCNGPTSKTHVVTVTPTVGAVNFTLGATSTRCQLGGTPGEVTYTATASNSTSISYSLDGASISGGNSINSGSGKVTYSSSWTGTSVITVTASGCNGPTTASHTVTITPQVTTPVFTGGSSSTRCQGTGSVIYPATANNTTGITYTLNGSATSAGNTINAATGEVTYVASWTGSTIITASAAGCSGPKTATHTVTITPTVGTPSFTLGATSARCKGAGLVTYTATASNNTGIVYSIDASSAAQGNSINAATGQVTYVSAWVGPTTITATASGCNGPSTFNHTVSASPDIAVPVFTLGSSSNRCQASGTITYTATATNSTSISYSYDILTAAFPGNSINSSTGAVTYSSSWFGSTTITATAAGCSGPTSASHTVTIAGTVATPVYSMGSTSTRCQGAGMVQYTATANNSTAITYTLNAASLSAGNTIDANTGEVTFVASWSGSSTITASAAGCSGPKTANHVVTITPTVGTPVFTLGATSTRCQLGSSVTYTATASNNTGIVYSLDALSLAGGNTINSGTGNVSFNATWSGSSTITATASGCNGPSTKDHIVNTTPTVSSPTFISGATSTRCQGTGSITYTATAANSTGISYILDGASITGGNSINSSTGQVIYASGWSGTTTITASAAGCNGPKTSQHIVTITPTVGTPVFTLGSTSTRCQGTGMVTYSATASNSTGMSYSLNAAAITAGNSINAATGQVTYAAGWAGSTIITASAAGCNGPKTSNHTVTITPTVTAPVFDMGIFSSRNQGVGTVVYSASAPNSTGISYTLDAASLAAGNTINAVTGAVTYNAAWFGNTVITANAAGCNGPGGSTHTVFINATVVGIPLYLSDPAQALDRVDPVATNDLTTATSPLLNNGATVIAIDASSSGFSANPGSTSFSVAHTTGSASNRLMLVGISQKNRLVTGVTYAGLPLTLVGEDITNGNARTHIYMLLNPPSGANNVVVSLSANPDKGIVVGVSTFSNVDQVNPLGVFASADGKGTAASTNVASGIGELVYNVVSYRSAAITAGAGQNQLHNINTTNEIYGGAGTYTGAASVTAAWTGAGNQDWAISAVSIKPILGTKSISFTQAPALCSDLIIKSGQNITITNYIKMVSGTMPVNPAITAQLKYGSTNIITITNPTYNSGTGIITWSGQLGSNMTIPSGQAIEYVITTNQAAVMFNVEYDSKTKPSKINMPVTTYIDISSIDIYNAPYPGGTVVSSGLNNTTVYIRAVVTAPFGPADITSADINIAPPGTVFPATLKATGTCSKVFEYPWNAPAAPGNYDITGTAYQGYENSVTRVVNFNINLCSTCPPVAVTDSARGAGGSPLIIDVLANDYDPNNNLDKSSLKINTQPNNGSAYLSNGKIIYLPNGTYAGRDTLTYEICDSTAPAPLCAIGNVFISIDPTIFDPCSEATQSHTYYVPFPENLARMALDSSTTSTLASNNIRTIISLKMPYPGMTIVWDEWEDGYEINALNPMQSTTKVWGDGNPYNGIAPGYANDIIPAGGSIVLDNTIPSNPRVAGNIFYDGKDKITSSGQITMTQICGEPSIIGVQCMKTNITPVSDFGTSFTIPAGQNFPSQDFRYSALFIRAAFNNTVVDIDKDNDGTLETSVTLNEGDVYLVNGNVLTGATVAASNKIGVELHFGGKDNYSSREVPIYPATWYSNTYYTPVPTTNRAAASIKDTSVVMLYNSLNRPINVNWSSGIPSSGTINIPGKTTIRFPLAVSATAAYKFTNPTGESFTAIQIVDSYTPGGGGNGGQEFDWSFNLISESRLTDFATVAWAPGSTNGTRNDNPIWVTPNMNTTVYVKYDGDVTGVTGLVSPCGLRYDVAYAVNVLNHRRILDLTDNDQSGIAVFTCNGAKLAAVYGEDPSTAATGNPSWDVGSTIQPFCKQKLIFANDDYARTLVDQPVTIPILLNDFGFLAVVNPASVNTIGLLQPLNGTVTVNTNGTVIYTPNAGYVGNDTFEYNVCSTPSPIVCDKATVYVQIAACPAPINQNLISGNVFLDKNKDGINNDGGTGYTPATVYLYVDGNCNGVIDANELKDSVIVDASGSYQFITYPEKEVKDDFDLPSGTRSCANGTDGNAAWKSDWTDLGDPSTGFCNTSQSQANTHAEIYKDGAFSNALRLKNRNVSATRTIDLSGASYAFLSFSYRRKSATLISGDNVIVQASTNGVSFGTVYTIAGDGTTDAAYVNIYNQDISAYAATTTYIRFLTNNNMSDNDTVYIDNVSIKYVKYPQCYITQINSSTIPSTYHLTTPGTKAMTATSGIFCLAPYDFGVAKNSISISGTLYNDANGLTDGQVNGTPTGYPDFTNMYAYLIDNAGKVAFRAQLDPATGYYVFPIADIQTNYTLRITTDLIQLYQPAPSEANLPPNWVVTGETYGTNNLIGVGVKPGIAAGSVPVLTGLVNVTNVNFGCERLPDSDDKTASYSLNIPGTLYALPALTGTDPEDGILGSGKAYKITSLPVGAVLYYNGISVVLNQVITNFDVTKFKIDPDDNTKTTTFTYASRDAAGEFDPTPATVLIDWISVLPVKLLNFSGRLNGTQVDLNWVTASEYNSSHFDIDRSADGRTYTKIANVAAKNNTTTTTSYSTVDPKPINGLNYYRLKMVDRDGAFEYSNVVIIRIAENKQLVTKLGPNPFTDKLDIYLSLTHASKVDFSFIDINGRVVYKKTVNGLKGLNWFTITDLGKLPPSAYMLKINTDDTEVVEKLIKR